MTVNHAISYGLRLSPFILPFAIMVVPDTLSRPGGHALQGGRWDGYPKCDDSTVLINCLNGTVARPAAGWLGSTIIDLV